MKKEIVGYERGTCPNCGAVGEFVNANYEWEDDTLYHYFTCGKCGAACCDYYTLFYSETNCTVEDKEQ